MEREEIIKKILGGRYEEGREIANIVLDYVTKNPDWRNGVVVSGLYKDSVMNAITAAVREVYGHELGFYMDKTRKREFIDVRQMSMYLLRKESGFSFHEIGEIFGKHHSSVIAACNNVKGLLEVSKPYAHDFGILEESFKKYL